MSLLFTSFYSDSWQPLKKVAFSRNRNYKNNKADGLYEEWDSDGRLIVRANLIGGKVDGMYEKRDENGQLIFSLFHSNDKLEGLDVNW